MKEGSKAPLSQALRAAFGGLRYACRSACGRAGSTSAALQQSRSLIVTSSRFPSGRERLHSAEPALPQAERSELIPLGINSDLERGGGEALTGHRSPRGARAPLAPLPRGTPLPPGAPFTRYGEIISLTALSPRNRASHALPVIEPQPAQDPEHPLSRREPPAPIVRRPNRPPPARIGRGRAPCTPTHRPR